ncbi:MAG TPA: hypothetical protein PKD64_13905 [Pirellulaceae bacterium]|nr:hypothetical protein [Pirellulaceae bacterium]HMO93281.1 hypothetical protein [Pirellulaceae bacterium]HMP70179.1 hypothetical protein [Pirellulaceae bacterium]
MTSTLATWEDEENNRHIQFSVTYSTENGNVEIQSITPEKISFVCPETNTCTRSIGIWTETGRNLVAQAIRKSAALPQLKAAIAEFSRDVRKNLATHIKLNANCVGANV